MSQVDQSCARGRRRRASRVAPIVCCSVPSWSCRRSTMRNNTGVSRTLVSQARSRSSLSRRWWARRSRNPMGAESGAALWGARPECSAAREAGRHARLVVGSSRLPAGREDGIPPRCHRGGRADGREDGVVDEVIESSERVRRAMRTQRTRDTRTEMTPCRALHRRGLRYRVHQRRPGLRRRGLPACLGGRGGPVGDVALTLSGCRHRY